jgi:ABC-type transport system involved in multi-copper enzyme maturation permease subunit
MTFMAVLVKEMRLRMRRERTILILVLYVLLLGLLTLPTLSASSGSAYRITQWSYTGSRLYHLLTTVQILLILFITPAFSATAINSEKERQTYEMLICSRISSFSLVTGKLFAGLSNSLLLIAASIPLFSLIFFLGGVAPLTVLQDLLTFVITALLVATLGFLCSTLFPRPAISTVITYSLVLLWLATPAMFQYFAPTTSYGIYSRGVSGQVPYLQSEAVLYLSNTRLGIGQAPTLPLISAWNPLIALHDTFFWPFVSPTIFYSIDGILQAPPNYGFAGLTLTPQVAYAVLSSVAIIIFFVLSLYFVKPNPISRSLARLKGRGGNRKGSSLQRYASALGQDTSAAMTT